MSESVLWIWLSGVVFALIHSLLAQNGIKNRLYRLGLSQQIYRLSYVVIAILTTGLWLIIVYSFADSPLYKISEPYEWLLRAVQLLGLWVFWASLRPIDVGVFLGLRQPSDDIDPFIEKGIYCYVRHPMYLAAMLILFASPVQSVNSINLHVVIALYFVVGAKFEEKRLIQAHPEYEDYRRRVGAFVPFITSPGK